MNLNNEYKYTDDMLCLMRLNQSQNQYFSMVILLEKIVLLHLLLHSVHM